MQAWDDFLKKQDVRLGQHTVDKWLRCLDVVHFDSGNLYLEAHEAFQISWFEEHIRPLLKTHLCNNNYRPIKVHLNLQGPLSSKQPSSTQKKEMPRPAFDFMCDKIDPLATLDAFVPGEQNLVAFRLLCEVAECVPLTVNPIFIWGGPGAGKTHLLMAIANALKKKGTYALYSRIETFTEHVVGAIRSSQMQLFRKTYRGAEVLLFDDVHLLARKDATQEEFFHTFNALHTAGRQIIMTSHMPPSLLTEIEPRLISRFEWGITLHLEKLSKDILGKVLDKRCEHLHFALSKEVRAFLLDRFPHSHSLHQALEALILRVHLCNDATYHRQSDLMSKEQAETFLKDLLEKESQQLLTPEKIIGCVSAYYGIRKEDILSKSQAQECVGPRQIAMYLCRKELAMPFAAIGRIFSRDHSTVMTSVKHIEQQLSKQDRAILAPLFEISKALEE